MTEKAQSQRSSDSSDLKDKILHYLPEQPGLAPVISRLKSVMRGFNSPIFARLLVPRRMLDEFNQNPVCDA